ncbi:MAG: HNH endonuclease [Actinobacteria bacterium]|nr:HNH endonuclease [Actinomycetota bacterium]
MSIRRTDRSIPERWAVVFCAVVIAVVAIALGFDARTDPRSATHPAIRWRATTSAAEARAMLGQVPVVEPSPEVAYDRVRDFGPPWVDVDHNGCDTRDDILRRDLAGPALRLGADGCLVESGSMTDPYTGRVVDFDRSNALAVQIDHVVPLHAAWILGAWAWPPERRVAFANDPRNLVAVDGRANQDKSDALADRWRPPERATRCVYAINTVVVHHAYGLGVTRTERAALVSMLGACW